MSQLDRIILFVIFIFLIIFALPSNHPHHNRNEKEKKNAEKQLQIPFPNNNNNNRWMVLYYSTRYSVSIFHRQITDFELHLVLMSLINFLSSV